MSIIAGMNKFNALIVAALCLPPLPLCADGLPDLGDVSQATISPQQERQIGEQSMFEIRADKTYLDDAEVNDYLNVLGYQLVANSAEPSQAFEFFAINDSAINAFSLPGGFVGVNTGLILITQSESELASVLAHEISHVTQHHVARMIAGQKVDTLSAVAAIAVAILAARSNPEASQAAIVGMQAGSIQRQLNFSRANEQEADRMGLATLQKAGFDVRAMPAFLERMGKATRLLEGNVPSYFRTHPVTSERVADIDNRVQQMPYHLVADSLEFHLVRARLNAMQRSPKEAIAFFTEALGPQKYGNQTAQRYGLALAWLRANQPVRAEREFAPLREQSAHDPMIATLDGQIRRANKDPEVAKFYRSALLNFPQHSALCNDYAELLMQDQHFAEALKLLDEQIIAHAENSRLYEIEARAYMALGRRQEAHHALAYTDALRGNLSGAIEQLELAQAAGSDYYELSAIESELKQFREIAAAHVKH
jgi:predicted Zn-dependent protease